MKKLILKVVDNFAPSSKYPQWGYSVDFVNEDYTKYFVEYPRADFDKQFDFKKGCTYELTANVKQLDSVLGIIRYKLTRIKDVTLLG